MVRLQTCCCCSLRTGALVIGYLNIMSIVFSLVSAIVQLSTQTYMDEQFKIAIGVTLSISCLALLVNSLMVYGVHEGKPGFLIAWLALKFLGLLILSFLITIFGGNLLIRGAEGPEYIVLFVLVPLMGLAWYLYVVVYSHYKELCDGPIHSRLQNKTYYSDDQIAIVSEK